jgi:hypothetical protein
MPAHRRTRNFQEGTTLHRPPKRIENLRHWSPPTKDTLPLHAGRIFSFSQKLNAETQSLSIAIVDL